MVRENDRWNGALDSLQLLQEAFWYESDVFRIGTREGVAGRDRLQTARCGYTTGGGHDGHIPRRAPREEIMRMQERAHLGAAALSFVGRLA
jgi:hypothetical protein